MTLDLSRPDWALRLAARQSLMPQGAQGINPAESARATAIFDLLRLPDVPGTPVLAEAAGPWFREIVGTFLGALDPATGLRLIRELFLLAPKKSSKTSYGAALMLTALLMNKRPRAEFLLIAPTQSVADLCFSQAAGMVDLDPELRYREADDKSASGLHVQQHLRCITRWQNGEHRGQLKVKSFDSSVLTGVRPAGVLLDELHEIAKSPQAANVVGQIRGGLLPIPEAFLAIITTQSDRPPSGVFKSELKMARAIRDGSARGTMLPILYEFPLEIATDRADPPAWQNSALWPMVTPNLDRSVTLPRLVEEFDTAKEKGPEEVARWASQHLNIQLGATLMSDRWAGADYWEDAVEPDLELDGLIERSDVAVVGIDGGGLDDLFGLAVIGRDRDTGLWLSWSRAWAHPIVLQRRKSEAARLLDLAKTGDLSICAKIGDDIDGILAIVSTLLDAGLLPEKNAIGVDQIGIGQLIPALMTAGISEEQIVAIPQGWKMAGAIKTAERKLADGTLRHADQALMTYALDNVKIEPRGNAIIATKQAAGYAKIDPAIALWNGVALMSLNPVASRAYFETHELLVLA